MRNRSKNLIIRELEPLSRGRKRSLGEVRRELRAEQAARLALAAEYGLDVTDMTADAIDQMLRTYEVEHEVEQTVEQTVED